MAPIILLSIQMSALPPHPDRQKTGMEALQTYLVRKREVNEKRARETLRWRGVKS